MQKIKNLKLKNPYFLAPMLEPNDIAFRLLCKKSGASLTYTGLLHPASKQILHLDDKPAIQLFNTSEKHIKTFIKKYNSFASLWDFNLGCPSKNAKKEKYGAFMSSQIKTIEKILQTMKQSTKKPITIKIRKSPNALKLLKLAEKYCDAISIHPRTSQQGYSEKPDIKLAEEIKKKSSIPVIYSGNTNLKNHQKLLKTFDFLMIGREAIGNPQIFAKLTNTKYNPNFQDYLKLAKKYNLPWKQLKYQAMNFTKHHKNAKKLRRNLIKVKTIEELEKLDF